tara:strand:+ start:1389 stop:2399 length:1011 start_codon:yes stop_codon:yes gene_type:complete
MTVKVGINGFGRMGRLLVRALSHHPNLELVHVNEIHGDVNTAAHLMQFDSVHGTWKKEAKSDGKSLFINGKEVAFTDRYLPAEVPWAEREVSMVFECTGTFRSFEDLLNYFDQDIKKVVVAAPVHDERALNVVMGCNDHLYDKGLHDVVTAASCTTNCIAPVVKVLHEKVGIEQGLITTIHAPTNTQVVVDRPLGDPRRARSALNSLIPTSTGSASAITRIFPELDGKLNGLAVRAPVLNASLSDCVFSLSEKISAEIVNDLLSAAAETSLQGILGVERRPLVSADFVNDTRSAIVDAPSTIALEGGLVKLLVWYDNEYGYVHRMAELADKVAQGF